MEQFQFTKKIIDDMLAMESNGIPRRDIAKKYGLSNGMITKVLRDTEYYLTRPEKLVRYSVNGETERDKRRGIKCCACEIYYERAHGYPVICKECAEHQARKGVKTYIKKGDKEPVTRIATIPVVEGKPLWNASKRRYQREYA